MESGLQHPIRHERIPEQETRGIRLYHLSAPGRVFHCMTTRHTAGLALVLISLVSIGIFAVRGARTGEPVAATALPVIVPEEAATSAPEVRPSASTRPLESAPARTRPAATSFPAVTASSSPETTAQGPAQPVYDFSFVSSVTGSVLDAMRAYASSSSFAFTSRDYPGMGAFIDSIGGLESGDGYYWILYVNGTDAALGASAQQVSVGDTVEWRYEKGY